GGAVSRVLVTGGHGFVASHLAKALLERGDAVRVLDRSAPRQADVGGERISALTLLGIADEVEVAEADLRDADAVATAVAGCDSVFHLAAQTIVGVAQRSPLETFETNVRGAWHVFEACRVHDVARVVFASSDKAYGSSPELPYREDFPLRAAYPYDASKAAADIVARSYANAYGLPLAVSRFANVYGGGDLNFSRLVPETVIALIEGRPPQIRSDGSPERDFLHVDDAVTAYLQIADALGRGEGIGEAFNAGGERPHSVREVVELISAAAGLGIEPEFLGSGSPDGEIDRQFVDSTKLRELTGWRPQVDLADGLRRTLEWYRAHPEARPSPQPARLG
ncbi:MAG TPA: NAD-dependent epimerase/dehydratase family protein, partial [Solirubrobacterales bacterium]|nr:NAD-dependent epimerase/dehydratase family protein [Solirubrobacterales bacterium]